ncbi:hypothetical protein BJV82DRAFT_611794 [Fennellomyces sp. T-0311]|nr:hypothetical protein BJV82DRAFT_611794 [Fennellomyces sp. T-0311]
MLHTTRRALFKPRFVRSIASDDASRPFPSPYPTRPAIPTEEGEGEGRESQLPVLMETATEEKQHGDYECTPFRPQHHFDTYKLLLALERQGFSRSQAEVVMKGIKFKLRESSAFIRRRLLLRSDLDNETYLFKAGLSELRTEVQTMRRNDTQMLQAEMTAVTREVEALEQRLKEDVASMRNEVTLDLNNRKNEGREELKAIDMRIQEINNKITVSLGDVRTGIEAVRWETIWKGMTGVAVAAMGIAGLGYLLTRYADHKAEAIRVQRQRQLKQLQEDARAAGTADMEVVY